MCITRCTIFIYFLIYRTDNNYLQNSFFFNILRLWSSRHALLHRPDGLVLLPAAADQGLQHKALEAQRGGFGSGWIDGLMMVDDGCLYPSGKLT